MNLRLFLFLFFITYSCSHHKNLQNRKISSFSIHRTCFNFFDLIINENHPDLVDKNLIIRSELSKSQLSYSPLTPLLNRNLTENEISLKSEEIIAKEYLNNSQRAKNKPILYKLQSETKAVWKAHIEHDYSNYRAEVLAYEIDQILKLNLVPATVERIVDGKIGSFQLYKKTRKKYVWEIENYIRSKLKPNQLDDSFYKTAQKNWNKQSFFDYLIDNGDRHNDNYLVTKSGRIYSIDNGLSFTGKGHWKKSFKERESEIESFLQTPKGKDVLEILKNLELRRFSKEVQNYLGAEDTQRLISRIEFIINKY